MTSFEDMKSDFADVEFVVDQVVTSPKQIEAIKDTLHGVERHPRYSPEHQRLGNPLGDPQAGPAHGVLRRTVFGARVGQHRSPPEAAAGRTSWNAC